MHNEKQHAKSPALIGSIPDCGGMRGNLTKKISMAILAGVAASLGTVATPAHAVYRPGAARGATNGSAQVVLGPTGSEVGLNINGFTGPSGFNPVSSGYPPDTPNQPEGFTPVEVLPGFALFAGTIPATTQAGQVVAMYCVDLEVETEDGLGYDAAPWSVTNIPNIGFVNRVIQTYYPQSTLPAGLASNAQKAAAVQAAIWFFTDKFVISTTGVGAALRPVVRAIVTDVLARGPLNTEPPFPQVAVSGPDTGQAGTVIGPYTVQTTASEATLTVTSAQVFRDAAGTQRLPNTFTLPPGGAFFLRTGQPASVTIHASAVAIAFAGATAAYVPADPANPVPAQAQKLIFAQNAALNVESSRTITTHPAAPGGGAAAGPELPATGSPLGPIALVGLLLAGFGTIIVYAVGSSRFRRTIS
jgi:Thioester domain